MNEKLRQLGAMVANYKSHAWRHNNLRAWVEVEPDMQVMRVCVFGNVDLVIQKGATSIMVAGENEKAVRSIEHGLTMGSLRFRQVASTEDQSAGIWPFRRPAGPSPAPKIVVALRLPFIPVIQHHGTGDVYVYDADQEELMLAMMGSGRIEAFGQVGAVVAALSGEGSIDLSPLGSRMAITTLSGQGQIKVNAAEHSKCQVSGVGKVVVMGHPSVTEEAIGPAGVVEYA